MRLCIVLLSIPFSQIRLRDDFFSYSSNKTYVVGTQKNRLTETVLLRIQKHMFKLMDKKIIATLR